MWDSNPRTPSTGPTVFKTVALNQLSQSSSVGASGRIRTDTVAILSRLSTTNWTTESSTNSTIPPIDLRFAFDHGANAQGWFLLQDHKTNGHQLSS